jgi:DNA-binding NarL/FixJ family response regulator
MYGEYLSTRALAFAIERRYDEALGVANRAEATTRGVETRILCSAVRAVVALDGPTEEEAAESLLSLADELSCWDPIVCVARASRPLALRLAAVQRHRPQFRDLLRRSNDVALAKAVGFTKRSFEPHGALSPRELEVADMLCAGMRNKEIAATLFISPATVKAHVRHIFDKLGARNRAEAVARYAESETAGLRGMASPSAVGDG